MRGTPIESAFEQGELRGRIVDLLGTGESLKQYARTPGSLVFGINRSYRLFRSDLHICLWPYKYSSVREHTNVLFTQEASAEPEDIALIPIKDDSTFWSTDPRRGVRMFHSAYTALQILAWLQPAEIHLWGMNLRGGHFDAAGERIDREVILQHHEGFGYAFAMLSVAGVKVFNPSPNTLSLCQRGRP